MLADDTLPRVLLELEDAWAATDRLFEIPRDAWLERPIPLRHPLIFYLGHLPAFAWNQIAVGLLGRTPFAPDFDRLFEFGIDPLSAAEASEETIEDWPPITDILAYRDRVRDELRGAWEDVEAYDGDRLAERLRIYHLVLEHELMHHETLQYILEELVPGKKSAPTGAPALVTGPARAREPIAIPAGTATLGARFEAVTFGWDNEFPEHRVEVPAFTIDSLPVTIGAFREFVDAGGYREPAHWSAEDFEWIQREGLRHPWRWSRDGRGWRRRTMFGDVALDEVAGWPVIVSHAEAAAFARWRGARLPSEAELHRAAYGTPSGEERAYPWGDALPEPEQGNLDLPRFDPVPAGSHPAGASAFGVHELVGNGWEWTSTTFGPFPGFKPWMSTYPGYSTDFFDGQHMVLFGASWATPRRLARRSFRNWFQRHYPYVFATFRCCVE